jgi:hypothetical protein
LNCRTFFYLKKKRNFAKQKQATKTKQKTKTKQTNKQTNNKASNILVAELF